LTMPVLTFIARVNDGLLLVASMDSSTDNHAAIDTYRSQAKQILKKLNPESVAKCSIESLPYVFQ
jgi:vesicle transport protein SEC22